jgi:outer membrane receptor protein involved in Fe transport
MRNHRLGFVVRPSVLFTVFGFALFSTSAVAADITGTVRDAANVAKPNTALSLTDGLGRIVAKGTSNAKGQFDFKDIAPGSYVVQATDTNAVLGSMPVSITEDKAIEKDLILQNNGPLNVVIASDRRQSLRNNLSPQTGTNAYKIDSSAIAALPQGSDTSFDKVLEQAPGVAEDSFGQTHVRGEHANLQYRLNGILLPEGISGFGQAIDSRIIDSATLLDGTLPAQYGYRTAGVVDIQTKSGLSNSGTASVRGGSYGTIEPSVTYGGTIGTSDYFVAASHLTSDLGIEAPTSSPRVIHDHTEQDKQFGYGSFAINDFQRIEVIAGNSIGTFQLPNNPNQTPNYTLNGTNSFNSSQLNERQFESNQYATLAWQGSKDGIDLQIAPYIRSSETHFRPDQAGDLIFNGVASDVKRTDLATGLQGDGSWRINAAHTLRSGFSLQNEHAVADNTSAVFLTNADGTQASDAPVTIADNHTKDGQLYGLYLQDEWKLTDQLTVNYGARYDIVNAYLDENQLSPRLGMVYKLTDATTLHAGYARYFTPPPLELVAPNSLSAFAGTSNAPVSTQDDPVKAERSHNFDIGATHKLNDNWQFGIDGYYKLVHDMLDEGQFGQALVFTPFNYQHGHIYGTELTANYSSKDIKAYANLAASRAMGKDIVSAQFNFDPDELAYINSHQVHLDHDQTFTASAGISYQVLPKTAVDLSSVLGSGLRSGFANTQHLPLYATFDAGATEDLDLIEGKKTQLRFSVVNLADTPYELRDGSGIGVGAPQWGQRRSLFLTLSQAF